MWSFIIIKIAAGIRAQGHMPVHRRRERNKKNEQ